VHSALYWYLYRPSELTQYICGLIWLKAHLSSEFCQNNAILDHSNPTKSEDAIKCFQILSSLSYIRPLRKTNLIHRCWPSHCNSFLSSCTSSKIPAPLARISLILVPKPYPWVIWSGRCGSWLGWYSSCFHYVARYVSLLVASLLCIMARTRQDLGSNRFVLIKAYIWLCW
jgi:hypothetical protein